MQDGVDHRNCWHVLAFDGDSVVASVSQLSTQGQSSTATTTTRAAHPTPPHFFGSLSPKPYKVTRAWHPWPSFPTLPPQPHTVLV
jgi:hypothetical protein